MKKQDYELDSRLLEQDFNPFQSLCESGDPRDQTNEYRAYKDYLIYLKISGNRITADSKKYQKLEKRDPDRWGIAYELQTDIESFVIFSHILLDKLGILIEILLGRRSENSSYHFKDHKAWFAKNPKVFVEYSELLSKMHWYDQNFNYLRNKIIEHSRGLAGSMRNFTEYRKINKSFGFLSSKDQFEIQNLINKYGENNEEILAIKPNPALMLDQFLSLIMEYNVELTKKDLIVLGQIVQRTGATIEVTVLSRHLMKFIEDTATLFLSRL